MNRIKTILTAIAVFAVVGGVLAFKAKKYIGKIYCTGTSGANTCPNAILNIKFGAGTPQVKYVQVASTTECSDILGCTTLGKQVAE